MLDLEEAAFAVSTSTAAAAAAFAVSSSTAASSMSSAAWVFFFFAVSSRKTRRLVTRFGATGVFSCAGVVVVCARVATRRGFRLWRRARGSASARPRVRPAVAWRGVPRFRQGVPRSTGACPSARRGRYVRERVVAVPSSRETRPSRRAGRAPRSSRPRGARAARGGRRLRVLGEPSRSLRNRRRPAERRRPSSAASGCRGSCGRCSSGGRASPSRRKERPSPSCVRAGESAHAVVAVRECRPPLRKPRHSRVEKRVFPVVCDSSVDGFDRLKTRRRRRHRRSVFLFARGVVQAATPSSRREAARLSRATEPRQWLPSVVRRPVDDDPTRHVADGDTGGGRLASSSECQRE